MKRERYPGGCILYLSQYFPPEVNAPANRVYETARFWVQKGRRVMVLTGFPNHPNGIVPESYRGERYRREVIDGIEVHRTWVYAAANKGFLRRILNYVSFMVSAVVCGLLRTRQVNCIIATSPQLLVAVAGWVLATWKRVPFVFEVRDIWPEEIVAVGALRNRLIIRLLEGLEMFLYRRADRIVAVAEGTIDILTRRGVPNDKIVLIPNGVDLSRFEHCPQNNWLREKMNLNGDFLISYIGTVGMAHKLDTLLEAARLLRETPRLRFLVVGDGAERENLMRRKEQLALDNLEFLDQQPRDKIAAIYHASDCCLVHLRRAGLFTRNIPSKIYEIMACGKPILMGTKGESRRLVLQAGCGVCFEPEDAHGLASGIRHLHKEVRERMRLGQAGYRFVRRHFSRAVWAAKYLHIIDGLIGLPSLEEVPGQNPAREKAGHFTREAGQTVHAAAAACVHARQLELPLGVHRTAT